jgi:hypothetical protein
MMPRTCHAHVKCLFSYRRISSRLQLGRCATPHLYSAALPWENVYLTVGHENSLSHTITAWNNLWSQIDSQPTTDSFRNHAIPPQAHFRRKSLIVVMSDSIVSSAMALKIFVLENQPYWKRQVSRLLLPCSVDWIAISLEPCAMEWYSGAPPWAVQYVSVISWFPPLSSGSYW